MSGGFISRSQFPGNALDTVFIQKSFLNFHVICHLQKLRIFSISGTLKTTNSFSFNLSLSFHIFIISSKRKKSNTFNTLLGNFLTKITQFFRLILVLLCSPTIQWRVPLPQISNHMCPTCPWALTSSILTLDTSTNSLFKQFMLFNSLPPPRTTQSYFHIFNYL